MFRPPPVPFTPVPLDRVPVTYPNVELVNEVLGFENCGVLVKLNASARTSMRVCSLIRIVLPTLPFSPYVPGPLMMFRPVVPKRLLGGCTKLDVSNHGLPRLIPWRIFTEAA